MPMDPEAPALANLLGKEQEDVVLEQGRWPDRAPARWP